MQYRQIYKNDKTMMYKVQFKKNLRNISARVDRNNEVLVTSPDNIDIETIDNFVLNNFEKFYDFIQGRKQNMMFDIHNDVVYLHGIKHQIVTELTNKKQKYEIIGNKIYLFLKDIENKERMIEKIFFDVGDSYITRLANQISKKYQFKVNEFATKVYKNKWGQCEPLKSKITFAIQLIMFNDEIIEYVIVHELCHLVHANHSPAFWKLVESYYPKYKWAREKLKFQI